MGITIRRGQLSRRELLDLSNNTKKGENSMNIDGIPASMAVW